MKILITETNEVKELSERALADVKVKIASSHNSATSTSNIPVEIYDEELSPAYDFSQVITYWVKGEFYLQAEDGEVLLQFDAGISGSYDIHEDADDKEIHLDDDLDCQENLTKEQEDKVRDCLRGEIKSYLEKKGYEVE